MDGAGLGEHQAGPADMTDPAVTETPTAADAPLVQPAPLDEVMLAMDVVDTLRHREQLVAKELAAGARDEDMFERLRQVYAAQGITVPERILREGVDALRENRFVYTPSGDKGARRWATLYVNRRRWAGLALLLVVLVAAGIFAYDAAVRAPRRALVEDLQTTRAQIVAVSEDGAASAQAATLFQQSQVALDRGAYGEARTDLESLQAILTQLQRSYTLRIVTNPETGVWRVPDINTGARNYYLIVEAIDANGRRVTLPIRSEEDGQVRNVSSWGLRVDEATFFSVADDKSDDGIIQNDVFGTKSVGQLEPEYSFPTTGAAITSW
ncbi:MAG TPA: DUF6384 family protein [Trueperaceae bacterium]|nr:DUF6384 family protein [Trueperaceae bacterium]